MKRRDFIATYGQAAVGFCALPLAGCRSHRVLPREIAAGDPWAAPIRELEKTIPQLMAKHRIPAVSVALIRDAQLLWRRGFGVKDLARRDPVDEHTLFPAASMTKPVFSYLVLKLCEAGVLNLDTPLIRYSPDRFLEGDVRLDRITARHVLSHAGGFQDIRSRSEPLKIHFPPGERFRYSGEGYFWLQSIVTRLTGGRIDATDCGNFEAGLRVCATDFDALVRRRLLAPFGMDASGMVSTDTMETRMARPHDASGRAMPCHRPTPVSVARYGAMGGLVTTPTDYARFMIEVMAPRPPDMFRLTAAGLDDMLRPQIEIETTPAQAVSWGLGWKLTRTSSDILVEHGGENPGFECFNQWSRQKRSGYVIMTNAMNRDLFMRLIPDLSRWVTGPVA